MDLPCGKAQLRKSTCAEPIGEFITAQHRWRHFKLWRIDQLVPAVGFELSLLANPLEAGASAAVDFEKGCYIGQEVIARLDSYDKVQRLPQRLLRLPGNDAEAGTGDVLFSEGKNAGFLTTIAFDPRDGQQRAIALLRHAFCDGAFTFSTSKEGAGPEFVLDIRDELQFH